MILAFSTQLNGKPTYFVEKIIKSIEDKTMSEKDMEMINEAILSGYLDVLKMDDVKPKLHTIREDKKDRWKPVTKIDFFINCRQPNMFRFAPVLPVVSVQKIEIYWFSDIRLLERSKKNCSRFNYVDVLINDSLLYVDEIEKLAQNDGFDSIEDFFNYFNQNFTGKIIHWTDFRY